MKRFEAAQVGDLVYCRRCGEGSIQRIDMDDKFPIACVFRTGKDGTYTTDGKWLASDVEPILFYRDSSFNYLTERPAPKLDWDRVPVDTKVLTVNGNRHYAGRPGMCFYSGQTSWTSEGVIVPCNNIELAEPIEVDGVVWPAGTKWEAPK